MHFEGQGEVTLRIWGQGNLSHHSQRGAYGRYAIYAGKSMECHTLAETVDQTSILTDRMPKTIIVDRGYQDVVVDGFRILRPGQRRGVTRGLKAMIKRQSAIEPTIGHMKTDGRLDRNPLKGRLVTHCMLCSAAPATTSGS